jgi:beta-1,3-galactosyltransferase 1
MYNAKVYPDYVSGTGYVISGPLVPILFEGALHVPLFHLEDVYTTGMVAKQANIIPENSNLFSFIKHPTANSCLYRKIITSHGLNPSELKSIWSRINDPHLDCTSVRLPKIGDPKFKKCHKAARLTVHRGGRRGYG